MVLEGVVDAVATSSTMLKIKEKKREREGGGGISLYTFCEINII